MHALRTSSSLRCLSRVAALLVLAPASGGAATMLRWMQPAPSAPVQEFRVYKGASTAQGELVYAGVPIPDAQGVHAAVVQIDEIDQGVPVYVWLTAANGAGESGPSNAQLYPEGCDPLLDTDCDGVLDDGAAGDVPCATGQAVDCDDNCPYWPNLDQSDAGGIRAGSAPDGVGDACQCGDVNGDGRVSNADSVILKRSLVVPPLATMQHPERCNVGGSAACTNADVIIIKRAQSVPPAATIAPVCEPALAP
jgi:hypothetical protein